MKKTATTRITALVLALVTIMLMGTIGVFAETSQETKESVGGAYVYIDSEVIHYQDISQAWSKAASSKNDAKIVLNEDWIADSNGSFGTGKHFYEGAIRLLSHKSKLELDLNGHKIDRNLSCERTDGSVFAITGCKNFVVTDSSEAKTGLITGGNNIDRGGAFFINASTVKLENITVAGNKTEKRGGAIYMRVTGSGDMVYSSFVTLDNVKLTLNTAQTGGAIYAEACTQLNIYDTEITGNRAVNDAGVHTEVNGLDIGFVKLGGKVVIADNIADKSGTGLMLDDGWFMKVTINYDKERPLSNESRIVVLTKTNDKTLRMTERSSNSYIEYFKCENSNYTIVLKGSDNKQFLDFVKI